MGALHAGHQSLIEIAKSKGKKVLVSIFVNPLQFEDKNDLKNYPKSLDSDMNLAEKEAGADGVFIPTEDVIYPGTVVEISAGELGKNMKANPDPNILMAS